MSVPVNLGMFTMPFHHPAKNYAQLLEEDRQAVMLADRLGFSEAYVGEHFSSWSERITSPLIFLATVIPLTKQIRLGTLRRIIADAGLTVEQFTDLLG